MHRYTVIYNLNWQSDTSWHTVTKVKRVEVESNENLVEQIMEIIQTADIQYIFEGWPKMRGE